MFRRALAVPDEAATALAEFDVLCCMRERTALPAALLRRLPRLRLITISGPIHRTLDLDAASEQGITVCNTVLQGGGRNATVELAWGLILSLARHLPSEVTAMRRGGWQNRIGASLADRTLGLLGLGRRGRRMVPVARAFEIKAIAWSPNLTAEAAAASGAERVEREALFRRSDVLSLHLVPGERTRANIGAAELSVMKPGALLMNTSRGPLVQRDAVLDCMRRRGIAGAALDVHDLEPMPDADLMRDFDNIILTPHLGYAVRETLSEFYAGTVENITAWLNGRPRRVVNPAPRPPAA